MADGSTKPIDAIEVFDKVMSVAVPRDGEKPLTNESFTMEPADVLAVSAKDHVNFIDITLKVETQCVCCRESSNH